MMWYEWFGIGMAAYLAGSAIVSSIKDHRKIKKQWDGRLVFDGENITADGRVIGRITGVHYNQPDQNGDVIVADGIVLRDDCVVFREPVMVTHEPRLIEISFNMNLTESGSGESKKTQGWEERWRR